MWPADWIPVSEKSSVDSVSGVQRGPLRKSVAPAFLTLPDGMLTPLWRDCEIDR